MNSYAYSAVNIGLVYEIVVQFSLHVYYRYIPQLIYNQGLSETIRPVFVAYHIKGFFLKFTFANVIYLVPLL